MLFASLKLTLQSLSKNFFMTLFMMVLFPILIMLMMSYFNADMYDQPLEDLDIPIKIFDEDRTQTSDQIRQTLQAQALHGVVHFTDAADFTITIPAGYARALEENQAAEITIEGIEDASYFQGEVLRSIVDTISKSHQSGIRLQKALAGETIRPDDAPGVENAIEAVRSRSAVEANAYEPTVRITAQENFSLQYLQLIFLLFLTSYAATSKQQGETTDLDMRMQTLPVHPLVLQINEMITGASQVFLFGFFYILINRVLGWGFSANLFQYGIALTFASFFVAGFSMAFTAIVPPKYASLFGSTLMIFVMFFGGMVGSGTMFQGTLFESLSRLNIDRILVGPFRDVNLGVFAPQSLFLLGIGAVLSILIVYGVERIKKGVAR